MSPHPLRLLIDELVDGARELGIISARGDFEPGARKIIREKWPPVLEAASGRFWERMKEWEKEAAP